MVCEWLQAILQEVWNQILLVNPTTMWKTITITCPEFKAALDEVNKYIAEQMWYTYKPKKEMSPQTKGKRRFKWSFWEKQRWYMDEYLDFIIRPSVSEEQDMWGSKITLTLIDKKTWEKTSETYNCISAFNKMCEYKRLALEKKRA